MTVHLRPLVNSTLRALEMLNTIFFDCKQGCISEFNIFLDRYQNWKVLFLLSACILFPDPFLPSPCFLTHLSLVCTFPTTLHLFWCPFSPTITKSQNQRSLCMWFTTWWHTFVPNPPLCAPRCNVCQFPELFSSQNMTPGLPRRGWRHLEHLEMKIGDQFRRQHLYSFENHVLHQIKSYLLLLPQYHRQWHGLVLGRF